MNYADLRTVMQLLAGPERGSKRAAGFRQLSASARRTCRRWLRDANVVGYGVGPRVTDGQVTGELALRVHVLRKLPGSRLSSNRIPPTILLPGFRKPVLIDVVESDIGRAQLALVGDGVSLKGSDEFGTIGCVVARSGSADLFAVTCRHVLDGEKGADVEWAEFPPMPQLPNPKLGTLAFKSVFASGNNFPNLTDIALVRLSPGAVSPVVRWLGAISAIRTTPLVQGERVRLCGYGTSRHTAGARGDCSGEVLEPHSNQTVLINAHGELGFRDLVLCTRFTSAMDSGAGVIDSENRLVGIHMAASSEDATTPWSAFQPIAPVISQFALSLPADAAVGVPTTAPDAHAAGATDGRAPPRVQDRAAAIDVLARTLWGEGRGEPIVGRIGIANVVLNRVAKDKPTRFGSTVEAVCQKKGQFSCWNVGDPNLPKLRGVTDSDARFRECLEIARAGVKGELSDNTLGSDHHHTSGVSPAWSEGKNPTVVIGRHLFFNNIL